MNRPSFITKLIGAKKEESILVEKSPQEYFASKGGWHYIEKVSGRYFL
jgi:hypothetical protein